MSAELNWTTAEEHLRDVRKAYTEIGVAGFFGLRCVLDPLQVRFEGGERTPELHAAMMATE